MLDYNKELTKEKYNYFYSLLSDSEKRRLFHLKDEWYDFDYENDEEIMEDNFFIQIVYKGYDALTNKLFIQVWYEFAMPEYHVYVKKNLYYDSFADYCHFLAGDIYDSACYCGYTFNQNDIDAYGIDLSKVKFSYKITRNINEIGKIENVKNVNKLHWDIGERRKENIVNFINEFSDFNHFLNINDEHKLCIIDFDIACRCACGRDPNLIIKKEPVYPDYDGFWKYATMKKNVSQLQQLEIGFDINTHMFYRTVMISGVEKSFNLYYPTIDELNVACNNDLSGGKFSSCLYEIDWAKYNVSNAELPELEIIRNCNVEYDGSVYKVVLTFKSGSYIVSRHTHSIDTTAELLAFMDVDLDDFRLYLDILKDGNPVLIQNI